MNHRFVATLAECAIALGRLRRTSDTPARRGEPDAELGRHRRPRSATASSGARPRTASLRQTPDPVRFGLDLPPATGPTTNIRRSPPMRPDDRVVH